MFKGKSVKSQLLIITALTAIIGILCYVYRDSIDQIMGVLIGLLISDLLEALVLLFYILREDKNKIADRGLHYDRATSLIHVKIGDYTTEIWYRPSIDIQPTTSIEVIDTDEQKFELTPLIQAHYAQLMNAHQGSFIENRMMIRLDDLTWDALSNTATLFTSRTTFYNDLVTNRAMDYKFADNLTLRDIYEGKKFVSAYKDSKMSNHIGINGIVFHGKEMLLAHRSGNATLSKNKLTSTVAIGLSLDTLRDFHKGENEFVHLTKEDILEDIMLSETAKTFGTDYENFRQLADEGLVTVYFLGLGQLLYTGGKPQFYYAVFIDESCNLQTIAGDKDIKRIDQNRDFLHITDLSLLSEGGYQMQVRLADGSSEVFEAEKSFYANYWHLVTGEVPPQAPAWLID